MKEMNCFGDLEINGMIMIVIKCIQMKLITKMSAMVSTLQQIIREHMAQSLCCSFINETVNSSERERERVTSSSLTMSKL